MAGGAPEKGEAKIARKGGLKAARFMARFHPSLYLAEGKSKPQIASEHSPPVTI